VLKAMSYEIAASEREPLLGVVPRDNVSDSNIIDSADPATVDHGSHVSVSETTNTPATNSRLQVFKRRWYILVLFSLVCMTQSAIWNTWGPLTQSAKIAFDWSLDDIALLTNWGGIMYVCSMVFFSWLMDVKGLYSFLF